MCRIIRFLGIVSFALTTTIETFNDQNCQDNLRSLTSINGYVSNGYPNGTCTKLNEAGQFSSFQIVEIDVGCAATIYGKDTDPNEPCSANIVELAQLPPACYNASWVYFSIDECSPPSSASTSSSSAVATSSLFTAFTSVLPSSLSTAFPSVLPSSLSTATTSFLPTTATSSISTATTSFLPTIASSPLSKATIPSSLTANNSSSSLVAGPSASPVQQTDSRHKTGAIVGGVVGGVAGTLILIALFSLGYHIGHRGKRQSLAAKDKPRSTEPPTTVPAVKIPEFDTQGAKVELDGHHGRIEAEGMSSLVCELSGAPDTQVSELAGAQNS